MTRLFFVYAAVTLTFGAGIVLVLSQGKKLEAGNGVLEARAAPAADRAHRPIEEHSESAGASPRHPLPLLLLQLVVIIFAARLLGALFQRFGQPAVIGEILAGIVLGPSVFGALASRPFGLLFPVSSLATLNLFAQIGVVLFLFVVGLELDLSVLRRQARTAVVVSHAGIVIPYFLGVCLALLVYREAAPAGVPFLPFALFLGIAMSITAFPVLARILTERRMTHTYLGSTAITCAAVDDVTAWSILALVVAVAGSGGMSGVLRTVGWTLAFIALMVFAVRPLLGRLFASVGRRENRPGKTAMAGVLILLLGSALSTEAIGIHALFGAFLAGAVMPHDARLSEALTERLEELSSVFLLPVFFAFTGLRTQIGLLNDGRSWALCLIIVSVAFAGKLGGCMMAARLTRLSWIDSFALGALMNTRGLMELIALHVGYELGILSPRIFAMMVLMALITTFATGPLLSGADAWRARKAARGRDVATVSTP